MAINLRKEGKSYNEIIKELNIPKSTLSNWLKDLPLTEEQNTNLNLRLKDKISRGRLKTSISLQAKRIVRENRVYREAEEEFNVFIKDNLFIAGILLYWAEGAKKNAYFAFVNSDPDMVVLMVRWIKKYLVNDPLLLKYRLYIHTPYKDEDCEGYWAKLLGISKNDFQKTIYKPTIHTIKKNLNYKGCLRVNITRIDTLRKIIAWQKLLIKYYDDMSNI